MFADSRVFPIYYWKLSPFVPDFSRRNFHGRLPALLANLNHVPRGRNIYMRRWGGGRGAGSKIAESRKKNQWREESFSVRPKTEKKRHGAFSSRETRESASFHLILYQADSSLWFPCPPRKATFPEDVAKETLSKQFRRTIFSVKFP